jgi:hypothetical protein
MSLTHPTRHRIEEKRKEGVGKGEGGNEFYWIVGRWR